MSTYYRIEKKDFRGVWYLLATAPTRQNAAYILNTYESGEKHPSYRIVEVTYA